jgi:uncharacterized protein
VKSRAFFRKRVDGIDLFVRLTPKSSRDHIDGVEIAADGQVTLVSGRTSRLKILRLSGDPGELARKLEEIGSG